MEVAVVTHMDMDRIKPDGDEGGNDNDVAADVHSDGGSGGGSSNGIDDVDARVRDIPVMTTPVPPLALPATTTALRCETHNTRQHCLHGFQQSSASAWSSSPPLLTLSAFPAISPAPAPTPPSSTSASTVGQVDEY